MKFSVPGCHRQRPNTKPAWILHPSPVIAMRCLDPYLLLTSVLLRDSPLGGRAHQRGRGYLSGALTACSAWWRDLLPLLAGSGSLS